MLRLLLVLAVASSALGGDCKGPHNTAPIWSGNPTFLRQVPNGQLFSAGLANNSIFVTHLYGSAYQMGFAHGQLHKQNLAILYPAFFGWIDSQIDSVIKFLPADIRKIIEEYGVAAGLDFTAELTAAYTPSYFFDEMHGLSDGGGVSYQQVLQVQMFPELIKAACSMFGAWGSATANSALKGGLLQLRALDWGIDNPLAPFSNLYVYHPTDGKPFATLGWVGWIGALTGYSQSTAICEKVWFMYNETSSRSGIPWHFLLRDILQFDHTLDDAFTRIINAHRTCSIFTGLGSNHTNQFRVVEYSYEYIKIFDPLNIWNNPAHPQIPDTVYVDKHTQPGGEGSQDPCMGSLMQANYGSLDPEITISDIVSVFKTGDLHIGIYDFARNRMYVSVAQGTVPAYARPFLRFDMTALFSLPNATSA